MDDEATVPGGARGDLRCPTAKARSIPCFVFLLLVLPFANSQVDRRLFWGYGEFIDVLPPLCLIVFSLLLLHFLFLLQLLLPILFGESLNFLVEKMVNSQSMAGTVGEDSTQHFTVLVPHLLRHMKQDGLVDFFDVNSVAVGCPCVSVGQLQPGISHHLMYIWASVRVWLKKLQIGRAHV